MNLSTVDHNELTGWLTRTAQVIDRSLRDAARSEATAALACGLGATKVGLPILAQLALLDDCLRVAHLAIEADGVVEPDELARVADIVRVAAGKYFAVLPHYEAFEDGANSDDAVRQFLRTHRSDTGPFGFASADHWRGLHLARRVERHTRNASPLRDHERMLARVMDEVFAERATEIERSARRRLRELFEAAPATGADPRAVAFCRDDGPEVFASVAHGSQIHVRDPYDVESIHAEAREALHRLIERATTPASRDHGLGRTLLVVGDSGAGKTHLLRAFRAQVCSQRRGYVGYLQMTVEAGDYTRYVLRAIVDSLERPYDAPGLAESALMYLSDGIAEGRVQLPAGDLEQLRSAELSPRELETLVGRCVDRILRSQGLGELDAELLHALLLLQRRDAALQRRVVRFLRCDPLGNYDRDALGGLASREHADDPRRTIAGLAKIMYELHDAALVLLVDQVEDAVPDVQAIGRLQQALDSFRAICDGVPSAVVVIACLSGVYTTIRPRLARALLDRLENDPPPALLTSQREIAEIEQMLMCRLDNLYSAFDVSWREDDPLFPFVPQQLEAVRNFRARDVLAAFRRYREACIAARAIVAPPGAATGATTVCEPSPTEPAAHRPDAPAAAEPAPGADHGDAHIERAWNEGLAASPALPDEDGGILELIDHGVRTAARELGLAITTRRDPAALTIECDALARRVAALCNGSPQRGRLARQLDALTGSVASAAIAIALRNSDWAFGPRTVTGARIAAFKQAGGRTLAIEEHELRAIAVSRDLDRARPPGLDDWRRNRRRISQLAFVRELLDLDRVTPAPPASEPLAAAPPAPEPSPRSPEPEPPPAAPPAPATAADPTAARLGVLTTIRAEPVSLPFEQIKKHVAFLGSPGSGKTTAALTVVEQLLERGISVLLVDRKGDLARYASDDWWRDPRGDQPPRKANLRERVKLALYTPGNPQGRPLRLPLVPSLRDATSHDREQLAKFAASGLTAMLGLPRGLATTHKESVLKCAIELLAEEQEITLELLHATINQPDPKLLLAVDTLQRHFAPLAECLQSLKIQRGTLLSGDGEALDVAALLPPPCERPRLTIINTAAFAEVPMLQFWVSRLLIELGRLARKRPSATLQAAAFFDEADVYIPATSQPASKEPMFDLLRRARAAGIGMMLATQNPGDIDYKARDNIGTWLVGKVASSTAIDKMRNLLANYPNVGPRLASQATGAFFVLEEGARPKEIRADRSLMATEQMGDHEVVALAHATATGA